MHWVIIMLSFFFSGNTVKWIMSLFQDTLLLDKLSCLVTLLLIHPTSFTLITLFLNNSKRALPQGLCTSVICRQCSRSCLTSFRSLLKCFHVNHPSPWRTWFPPCFTLHGPDSYSITIIINLPTYVFTRPSISLPRTYTTQEEGLCFLPDNV